MNQACLNPDISINKGWLISHFDFRMGLPPSSNRVAQKYKVANLPLWFQNGVWPFQINFGLLLHLPKICLVFGDVTSVLKKIVNMWQLSQKYFSAMWQLSQKDFSAMWHLQFFSPMCLFGVVTTTVFGDVTHTPSKIPVDEVFEHWECIPIKERLEMYLPDSRLSEILTQAGIWARRALRSSWQRRGGCLKTWCTRQFRHSPRTP